MMDATFSTVIRLFEQGLTQAAICRRLKLSEVKVRKILITAGLVETRESKLLQDGLSIDEIADIVGKSRDAVTGRLPYSKGIYNAEYQTKNALRIKKCRQNKAKRNQEG